MPDFLYNLLSQASSPFAVVGIIFSNGGLVLLFPILVYTCVMGWLYWIQNLYSAKKKMVLLAIDVPKVNEQSMKAVEQILATLHGIAYGPNFKEKWWIGFVQDKIALEIVSIEGYIQYFIYCDDYNVDLVKGSIFAQYPDAEIVEVEDYAKAMPSKFPDEVYDLSGCEILLAKPDFYPIRTYEHFEHPLTGIFADPMASLLENMSRLRPGEQFWLQFVITPASSSWRDEGLKEVDKLIGKKPGTKKGPGDYIINGMLRFLEAVHDAVVKVDAEPTKMPGEAEANEGKFLNMTTGEKLVVEEVEKKLSLLAYKTKMRFVYVARKDVFNGARALNGIWGALKQFSTQDLNAITGGQRLDTSRPTFYFVNYRKNSRRTRLMLGYRYRSNWSGQSLFHLNIRELASMFHFPVRSEEIRGTALVSKTETKKAEPPSQLPFAAANNMENPLSLPLEQTPAEATPTVPGGERPSVGDAQRLYPPPKPPKPGFDIARSMDGLPPGIRPVQQPTSGMTTTTVTTATPVPPPPPAGYHTPRPAAAPPAAQTPTQPSPQPPTEPDASTPKGAPPSNLPIG